MIYLPRMSKKEGHVTSLYISHQPEPTSSPRRRCLLIFPLSMRIPWLQAELKRRLASFDAYYEDVPAPELVLTLVPAEVGWREKLQEQ